MKNIDVTGKKLRKKHVEFDEIICFSVNHIWLVCDHESVSTSRRKHNFVFIFIRLPTKTTFPLFNPETACVDKV